MQYVLSTLFTWRCAPPCLRYDDVYLVFVMVMLCYVIASGEGILYSVLVGRKVRCCQMVHELLFFLFFLCCFQWRSGTSICLLWRGMKIVLFSYFLIFSRHYRLSVFLLCFLISSLLMFPLFRSRFWRHFRIRYSARSGSDSHYVRVCVVVVLHLHILLW